jgi:flagellar motor switch protein FliM
MRRENKDKKDGDVPTEILSQEEIEQLLTAIDAGSEEQDDFLFVSDRRKIRIYDFLRPDKFSKEQIRAMAILHETFARQAASTLTRRFNAPCHVHVALADQLSYKEFIKLTPNRATRVVLRTGDSSDNKLVIEIDSKVSFGFINRVFSGRKRTFKDPCKPAMIKRMIIKRVVKDLAGCLSESWKRIIPGVNITLDHIDANPQLSNLDIPETFLLITIEMKIDDAEGMVDILYPQDFLNKIMERLIAESHGAKDIPQKKYKLINRWDMPVEMTAEVFRRDYPIREILDWKVEELLLPLVNRIPHTCYLRFADSRIFQCEILKDDKWFSKKIKVIDIAKQPQGTEGKMDLSGISPVVAGALAEAAITISVELGRTVKTINEILKMDEGTIVELDKQAGELVDIKANGVLIAKGEVVVIDDDFGVRITEILNAPGSLNRVESKESRGKTR